PLVRERGRALECLAADGDRFDAARLELVQSPLQLAQLGAADRAVQAPEEHDHRELLGSLIAEAVSPSAQEGHCEVRCRLPRANTIESDDAAGGGASRGGGHWHF